MTTLLGILLKLSHSKMVEAKISDFKDSLLLLSFSYFCRQKNSKRQYCCWHRKLCQAASYFDFNLKGQALLVVTILSCFI